LDGSDSSGKEGKKAGRKSVPIELSNRERRFIIFSDFLIVGFIVLDLFYITDIIRVDLTIMTLANLIMVAFTYYYFRFKRRITIRTIKET